MLSCVRCHTHFTHGFKIKGKPNFLGKLSGAALPEMDNMKINVALVVFMIKSVVCIRGDEMDIHSAEGHVKKLLTYVEELSQDKPKMYTTTKNKLKDLASTCQKIVHVVSTILEQEILDQPCEEFSHHTDNNVLRSLDLMESEILQIRKFMSGDCIAQDNSVPERSNSTRKISSSCRKQIISRYGNILSDLTESCKYPVVSDCAKLLSNWFDCRFLQTPKDGKGFNYNIRRLPFWITDIVIAYGKHVQSQTRIQFIQDFNNWCESLVTDTHPNKYAVPYDIYQIDTNLMPSDMTLAAIVIWDVLFDSGLDHLCVEDGLDVYLSEDMLYKRCGEICPQILDDYRNYKDDNTILSECNLVNEFLGGESE